jgi:TPR repeat protein
MYYNELGGVQANKTLAVEYFMRATEHFPVCSYALLAMGHHYNHRNLTAARLFYERAALVDNPEAMLYLAELLINRGDSRSDIYTALQLLVSAINLDNLVSIMTVLCHNSFVEIVVYMK